MASTNDEKTVHLEVQEGGGQWHSAGQVQMLDEPASPASSLPTSFNREQLPTRLKRVLSPDPKIRKHYYLFRHATDNQPNTNLLIFLHGAGDSHVPFDKLGQKMALPQTATLSISAKGYEKLPFDFGYTWFKEMDYATGMPLAVRDKMKSLEIASAKLWGVLEELIIIGEWIVPERVFFLGFGTGAALAMQICVTWAERNRSPLGGAICVSGGAAEFHQASRPQPLTPMLIMSGEKDESFPPRYAEELKQSLGSTTELFVEPNKGQGMIASENEMKRVMEFFSQRLVRMSSLPMSSR